MKRLIGLLYGVVAYAVFLVAFLYAIGFVGNLIVPKSVDSGPETTFMEALLIDALLLGIFAIQHSGMARPTFKRWWTKIVGPVIERSTYVLLSSLSLFLIYWKWQPITSVVWEVKSATLVTLLNGLFFFGWLVVLLSTFMINHFELFGLKQVFDNMLKKESNHSEFKMNFFYRIVRHPIMVGFIIAFWSAPLMTLGHFIFTVTTTLYIVIAVKFLEERNLREYHGKEYEEYQQRVPMFVPFTKMGSKSVTK